MVMMPKTTRKTNEKQAKSRNRLRERERQKQKSKDNGDKKLNQTIFKKKAFKNSAQIAIFICLHTIHTHTYIQIDTHTQ